MTAHFLIAGAGIGGLGAALALGQIGCQVTVLEQSAVFSEVGAGLQISPNAYKVLNDWGLADVLTQTANFPQMLQVRDGLTDKLLGQLTQGATAQARYGYPFATLHRADLHGLLLQAVRQLSNVSLHVSAKVSEIIESNQQVTVKTEAGESFTADALIGADGLWSHVRQHLSGDAAPRATGHTAWRALLPLSDVPPELQQDKVTAWLAPDSHTIAYPVQQGKMLNLVYCCENDSNFKGKKTLQPAYLLPEQLSKSLKNLLKIASNTQLWTRWDLFDRPPIASSAEMFNPAHPRIALLGDAAHPMLPYLAQGAAMALEDVQALAMSVQNSGENLPAAFQHYAQSRWQRNAAVQTRASQNGVIFHAKPPVSWARNAAMGLLGEKLLDMPWLYGYATPVKSTF